jgi:hypothetical protein
MGLNHSPSIVTNGLILALDAANPKSYLYAENLLNYSANISAAGWGSSNITKVLTPVLAPDGTLTANQVTETSATAAYHYINQVITRPTASAYYTFSTYVKSSTRQLTLRMETVGGGGVVAGYNVMATPATVITAAGTYNSGFSQPSSQIQSLTNGWFRISVSAYISDGASNLAIQIFTSNTASNPVYDGDGTSNFYVWNSQLERSNVANPYVATAAANVIASTTLTDLSLSKNNGALANTPSYNSSNGNGSLVFSGYGGANNYVSFGNLPSTLSQLTVEVWVNLLYSGNQGTLYIIGQTNSVFRLMYGVNSFSWVCATTNNAWYSAGTTLSTSALPVIGVWNHVVVVYDGTNNKCYVNGVLSGTSSGSVSGNVNMSNLGGLNIMKSDASNLDNGAGQLSVARIYNRGLTAEEILQNYNAHRGRYGL